MAGLSDLCASVRGLRDSVRAGQSELLRGWRPCLKRAPFVADAANLAAYISFRRQDLRELQDRLAELGLSSLGRCEAHVLATLDAVLINLDALLGGPPQLAELEKLAGRIRQGNRRLQLRARELLGPVPRHHRGRIMVTLPTEAASDRHLVRDLIKCGMSIARINCAHDDEAAWTKMVGRVRAAATAVGQPCRILMDLAGPKLRTGEMAMQPAVVHLKPKRDAAGDLVMPAYVMLDAGTAGDAAQALPDRYPCLPVPADWLQRLKSGDAIELVDVRGRKRALHVVERAGEARVMAGAADTVWLAAGVELHHVVGHGKSKQRHAAIVGPLASRPGSLTVHVGDLFLLARVQAPGLQAFPAWGAEPYAGHIPCAQPEVLDYLRPGERVFIDDGRIAARIERLDGAGAWLRVTRASSKGDKIRSAKGLNFPDSDLGLSPLMDKDLRDLDFVARQADLVGYSFVQSAADMDLLAAELTARGAAGMGRVAKIETRKAVANLPEIIVHGAGAAPFGLMIARGDLAMEVGWERMAEIQEEILWLAEAARVPVVWATQVLEGLIKTHLPSRAEMTDAAMSERAECVMLNKGPFVLDAMAMLDDIVRRMRGHQRKKTARLRALHW
ncbi:pyruvate kinase [Sulfuritortus calidifontis]|uniref:pyruvate kinase n=1 Tax=Sulfuritortus calidifontis TaxID=1914471 RepID=A0A4R3JUF1_9PROT|nr:pyruvate kinase [Sulfuritortus calidifontis]TCS71364.1 pyruvate kinase [Sulfuritortus calidifontis]